MRPDHHEEPDLGPYDEAARETAPPLPKDIVNRLRETPSTHPHLHEQAAAEIEHLREHIRDLANQLDHRPPA